MSQDSNRKTIGIIILAAGGSNRFGEPKQLFKLRGETLVHRAAKSAIDCNAGLVIVSVGANREAIEKELTGLDITSVFNVDWQTGMASSLTTALKYLTDDHHEIDAVLFMVCDQPRVTSKMLNEIIETYQSTKAPIVASEYSDTLGVPALFDSSMFDELLELKGDEGARSIIKRHGDRVHKVPMPEAAFDIDSVADIEHL